ncbi:MAG: ABC transporter ATP-binding protein [Phycisphaerales bacterium]|nr:ABC transporter ATP-binding protein [Phycisphaerales bacterium]
MTASAHPLPSDRDPPAAGRVLLDVRDLSISLSRSGGAVELVDCVSFSVAGSRALAIVGESGCGKTVTALSLARLLPDPPLRIRAGRILLHDPRADAEPIDIARLDDRELTRVRGCRIGFVFQEPMSALHPLRTIGDQVAEGVRLHLGMRTRAARDRAAAWLERVGVDQPLERMRQFPHELSGGLQQRVMIAMALAMEPSVLVADEPTTALDVTLQARILDLLAELARQTRLGLILITHDLGVVARIADEVAVMYAGRIVEKAPVQALFSSPRHPYTQALLECMPRLDRTAPLEEDEPVRRLATIPGRVPDPADYVPGCRFAPRCALTRAWAQGATASEVMDVSDHAGGRIRVLAKCARGEAKRGAAPPLIRLGSGQEVACWEVAPPS